MSTEQDRRHVEVPADVHDVYLVGALAVALLLGNILISPVVVALAAWRLDRAHPVARRALGVAAAVVLVGAVVVLFLGAPV